MASIGDTVFYRAGAADGSVVSTAIVTATASDTVVGLAVKEDQKPWVDRPAVKLPIIPWTYGRSLPTFNQWQNGPILPERELLGCVLKTHFSGPGHSSRPWAAWAST